MMSFRDQEHRVYAPVVRSTVSEPVVSSTGGHVQKRFVSPNARLQLVHTVKVKGGT